MSVRERAILCGRAAILRAASGACALVLAAAALAQDARPPPGVAANPAPTQVPAQATEQAAPPAPVAPSGDGAGSPAFRPGFIDAVGRWFEDGASKFKSGMQDAQEKLGNLGNQAREAAKEATGSVSALPNARARTGRERCMSAQNGAPDCQTAAVALCRGGGFASGKILDTQSEQKCSAKPFLEGRAPNSADCPTEIFVTRAMCQ